MVDVLVLLAIMTVLVVVFAPQFKRANANRPRIRCVNNLKQIGLSFQIWARDHNGKYPMQVLTNDGGTMEFIGTPETFRHFQVMSNELNTPKILICPKETDKARRAANFFGSDRVPSNGWTVPFANNLNLSYFVGADADPLDPDPWVNTLCS